MISLRKHAIFARFVEARRVHIDHTERMIVRGVYDTVQITVPLGILSAFP